eukprot:188034_1
MCSNIGLEFPMNVPKFNRTEIDHIAKISGLSAIHGQYILSNDNKQKPLLPNTNISTNLQLRHLLPPQNIGGKTTYSNPSLATASNATTETIATTITNTATATNEYTTDE